MYDDPCKGLIVSEKFLLNWPNTANSLVNLLSMEKLTKKKIKKDWFQKSSGT